MTNYHVTLCPLWPTEVEIYRSVLARYHSMSLADAFKRKATQDAYRSRLAMKLRLQEESGSPAAAIFSPTYHLQI